MAVAVQPEPPDRVRREAAGGLLQQRDRILVALGGGTPGAPLAHEPKSTAKRTREVSVRGIGTGERVGGIEGERAQALRVATAKA